LFDGFGAGITDVEQQVSRCVDYGVFVALQFLRGVNSLGHGCSPVNEPLGDALGTPERREHPTLTKAQEGRDTELCFGAWSLVDALIVCFIL
jgi:hypothetical protein